MSDDGDPRVIERARGGDWDAIEDLVGRTIAPTFDAALHLFGDDKQASDATEEALLALLVAVRRGSFQEGDPLVVTAQALAAAAEERRSDPLAAGLAPDDLVAIGCRPDNPRGAALAKIPRRDRIAAILAASLDLAAAELGPALGRAPADVRDAIDGVLGAIPHPDPAQAFRDILDARASRARLPADVEERVLDRFERS